VLVDACLLFGEVPFKFHKIAYHISMGIAIFFVKSTCFPVKS